MKIYSEEEPCLFGKAVKRYNFNFDKGSEDDTTGLQPPTKKPDKSAAIYCRNENDQDKVADDYEHGVLGHKIRIIFQDF